MNTLSPERDATASLRQRLSLLDTAALSDAIDSLHAAPCVLPGIVSRVPGTVACGRAFTVKYRIVEDKNIFHNAADYIDDVPPESVIVVDNAGSRGSTTWGSLLTTVAQKQGIAGTVVHGSARDVRESREAGYPLFSTEVTMVSGKNRVMLDRTQVELEIAGTKVFPGDWIVADDNGALCIPSEIVEEVTRRAESVDRTERRIRQDVLSGNRLDAARSRFGYKRPWDETGSSNAVQ